MTSTEIKPARARRRAVVKILQKVQHAVPGVVLFQHGWHAFRDGAHGWHLALGAAELVTSLAVFGALFLAIRELRSQMRGGGVPHLHTGIDWTDIFLGLMLFTEAAAKYPVNHKIWSPTSALAIVMIVLGLFGGKIAKWKAEKRSAT